mmetsp:Transcript_18665/g.34634  ORF Transcript_18665/g.34634 Transcript_18665/m.34634 type:complete len:121 (+) Transcript_18665:650-1012(+)
MDDNNNMDNLTLSPNTTARKTTAAVTLNAGTGAELAAAVRQLTNQRKNSNAAIPGDYGYDDPCNGAGGSPGSSPGTDGEEDEEAHLELLGRRFETEWRGALKRAAADFDRAMQLFWSEVR